MEDLYTLKEVSNKYKVSTRTVRREIDKHGIPIVRVGRQIRIPESSMKLLRLIVEKRRVRLLVTI